MEQVLGWLPADTEMVLVNQTPIVLPPYEAAENATLAEKLQLLATGSLSTIRKGEIYRRIAGSKVAMSFEGARRFRAPRGLGGVRFEGCSLLIFDPACAAALDEAFSAILAGAPEKREISGQKVALFREELENDIWTILLALPRPGLLACATDEPYLKEVLGRIAGAKGPRALPPELPEWRLLEPEAPVWALRHYDSKRGVADPTSPTWIGLPPGMRDDDAIGLVLLFPRGSAEGAELRCPSENEDALEVTRARFLTHGLRMEASARLISKGVVSISIRPKGPPDYDDTLYVILWAIGHGVFL